MSDVYVPPPPPPTPPRPPRPPSAGYDFLRPFTFLFDDPRWMPKTMMGGLFVLLSVVIIGIPFVMGYFAKTIRNVVAGVPNPLPEWDTASEFLNDGLVLFGVWAVYMLPITILSAGANLGSAIFQNVDEDSVRSAGTLAFGLAQCVFSIISFVLSVFVPAAMLMVAMKGRFSAGFEIGKIWSFMLANIGSYVLALITSVIASILALPGLLLCCIGFAFTSFWAQSVWAYAIGQVYRLSPEK